MNDLTSLSKDSLIVIIKDLQNELKNNKDTNKKDLPTTIIESTQKKLAVYNLTDGDGYNKEHLLVNHGIVYVGVCNKDSFIIKCGGINNYFNKLKTATHIISYKPKKHYGKDGGVFKNIYKLNKPYLITKYDDYKNSIIIEKAKLDTNLVKYMDEQYKWMDDPNNYCILWSAELIKEIKRPRENSGLTFRSRFGYVNNKHELYKLL